jgi:hypothetical protein
MLRMRLLRHFVPRKDTLLISVIASSRRGVMKQSYIEQRYIFHCCSC